MLWIHTGDKGHITPQAWQWCWLSAQRWGMGHGTVANLSVRETLIPPEGEAHGEHLHETA